MKENKNGYLVISLDFELIWGVFDKVKPSEKEAYFQRTKKVIPEILNLFEKQKIKATWATVGMLFNENWQEWEKNIPHSVPHYSKEELSPYRFADEIEHSDSSAYTFAKDLVKLISDTPGQEMATHTYSHYYCLEEGQTLEDFKADLEKAIEVAARKGITLKSLVFPRNQFNEDYLRVCHDLGIENVRSNPNAWYWKDTQKDSFLSKVFRTGDAYVGPVNKSYPISSLKKIDDQPLAQKASRLLRPYTSNTYLNNLKLKRIKKEMFSAAQKKEIYHLWWHPHNFGDHPRENIDDLKVILDYFNECRKEFNFQSAHMQEINRIIS